MLPDTVELLTVSVAAVGDAAAVVCCGVAGDRAGSDGHHGLVVGPAAVEHGRVVGQRRAIHGRRAGVVDPAAAAARAVGADGAGQDLQIPGVEDRAATAGGRVVRDHALADDQFAIVANSRLHLRPPPCFRP